MFESGRLVVISNSLCQLILGHSAACGRLLGLYGAMHTCSHDAMVRFQPETNSAGMEVLEITVTASNVMFIERILKLEWAVRLLGITSGLAPGDSERTRDRLSSERS